MTQYTVQYVLPCENPEKSVLARQKKGVIHFEVPINYPNAHNLSLLDLFAAWELSGKLDLSTTPNRFPHELSGRTLINKGKKSDPLAGINLVVAGHQPIREYQGVHNPMSGKLKG